MPEPKEIWKLIIGYEGFYEISSLGRVKSLPRKMNGRFGGYFYTKEKILAQIVRKKTKSGGYLKVDLSVNSKKEQCCIHILVAKHFIPNPNNKPCVNHINRNSSDNRVENLEWNTHKENTIHWIESEGKRIINKPFGFNISEYHLPKIKNEWEGVVSKLDNSLAAIMWKSVVGYEGLYIVSEYGHVIAFGKTVIKNNQYGECSYKISNKIVQQVNNRKNKRFQIHLRKDGKDTVVYPHILVAKAFIKNTNNYPCVNHKDGDSYNNHLSNLEWCSHSHNQKHAYKYGLRLKMIGDKNVRSKKVVATDVDGVAKLFNSTGEAQREYGICSSSISNACTGKRKLIKGIKFKYA